MADLTTLATVKAYLGLEGVWAASTLYPLKAQVSNGGQVYECITSGTSASVGGPAGTSADTTDGSAHWKWLRASDDVLLARLISSATQRFTKEIGGRSIVIGNFVDTKSGENTYGISLDNTPVVAVTSVTIDGEPIPAQVEVNGDGWAQDGNRVELVGYVFTVGVRNVEIAYSAGFGTVNPWTIPADVEQAVVELVADLYKKRDRIGQMSRSIGGESVTFQTLTLPNSVQSVIDLYRRRRV